MPVAITRGIGDTLVVSLRLKFNKVNDVFYSLSDFAMYRQPLPEKPSHFIMDHRSWYKEGKNKVMIPPKSKVYHTCWTQITRKLTSHSCCCSGAPEALTERERGEPHARQEYVITQVYLRPCHGCNVRKNTDTQLTDVRGTPSPASLPAMHVTGITIISVSSIVITLI